MNSAPPEWGPLQAFAPAKVNLTLHVVGHRRDGYHLLDSLVVFCGIGDHVTLRPSARPALRVVGTFAEDVPTGSDNLVLRAAALAGVSCEIELDKRLPVAAGIGGGSSDAGAVLRALNGVAGACTGAAEQLGADVPVCVAAQPARMQGVGERLSPLPTMPPMWLVLVNPLVPLRTADVFAGLASRDHPPMPDEIPHWRNAAEATRWLAEQRNDLEAAAIEKAPAVGAARAAVAETGGCLLARMSGSGATVFGLFASSAEAEAAAKQISRAQPGWWVRSAGLTDQATRSTT
ncbi:4-(cytidine 5'-diphospho)-2-C-methyl-D-erythritol kinase [Roseitranquillus sediminis]|uniref:4-(cytidine 5'-diphospho)-2-C-methyl-D-erythritol kinase n=1 Tax=Roseitranquillus sediminis TaxID=2809051 RepID=UPI001D0C0283|nr:4-(cytidine 5'-diphospho)-2-C-methyl-D-erythritol kinase [Roseitranquillus sediminis]MBM9593321.1 4-(cytidine 5'-diphospho)-2-C-methyl-D-erythritol kinase [Roseitranquillus sediminis]